MNQTVQPAQQLPPQLVLELVQVQHLLFRQQQPQQPVPTWRATRQPLGQVPESEQGLELRLLALAGVMRPQRQVKVH